MNMPMRFAVLPWLAVMPLTVLAGDAPVVPARLAARPAIEWLRLDAAQAGRLLEARRVRDDAMADLDRQARRLNRARDVAALAAVCERSRAAQVRWHTTVQGLLTPAQRERLQVLEQALAALPAVESAQAAGLLAAAEAVPPAGLPQGAVAGSYVWQRSPMAPLPGCTAPEALPELGPPDGGAPVKPVP